MTYLEKYYLTKLSGDFYGHWEEIDQKSKDYVASTTDFKKWKMKESIKNLTRSGKNKLTNE